MSSKSKGSKVERNILDMKPDSSGSLVTVVKLNADEAYVGVPDLLKRVIDESDAESWRRICNKIDYIYVNLDHVLGVLGAETDYGEKIREEVQRGKKILYKPNLVIPEYIDPFTHGESSFKGVCTEWPFIAALMRWIHDNLDVSYHQMALGETATLTSARARARSRRLLGGAMSRWSTFLVNERWLKRMSS